MNDKMNKTKAQDLERKILALAPEQQDKLQRFLDVLLASKTGEATELDLVRFISDLPQEDAQAFTDIIKVIKE